MPPLAELARTLTGLDLADNQIEAFQVYQRELLDWNSRFNLTAITDPDQINIRLFVDSLTCLNVIPCQAGLRLIDVGSGAGFPGLPIKIACPALHVTLLESVNKKAVFLEHIIQTLGLTDIVVHVARAEDIARTEQHRERYDIAIARAVAAMPILMEYLLPLVRVGGKCIAQKGANAEQETAEARQAIATLGGRLIGITAIDLPDMPDRHTLVEVKKITLTPAAYPRRAGMPTRRPLGVKK
jgi:16S rRNA (guanine527-N7)-methyltransferase